MIPNLMLSWMAYHTEHEEDDDGLAKINMMTMTVIVMVKRKRSALLFF